MKYTIFIKNKSTQRQCLETKNLMDGLCCCSDLAPKGCHNGACGLCKIHVIQGVYETKKMNRVYISEEEEKNNILLACRVFPRSDMKIEFLPRTRSKNELKPRI